MSPGSANRERSECTLEVSGMDCASCAASVEKALRHLAGVEDVQVDVIAGRVSVRYEETRLHHRDLADAITRTGYRVVEPAVSRDEAVAEADVAGGWWERRGRLVLAVVSGVLWALSLAAAHVFDNDAAGAVLAVGAMVAAGWYIVPRGIRAGLSGSLDMNFLMSVAAIGALVIGEFAEAASALFLFAVAQLLESNSMDRARHAIRALMELSPAEATVMRDGGEVRMAADRVQVGEVVVVRPGEKIAVDGVVIRGRSSVDEASITGESVPVGKEQGAEVFAGTMNGDGALEVRSTKAATDTTLARIIHSVETARSSRAPSQSFVDRFARVYTPLVVLAALIVFLVPPLVGAGAWADWFYRALVLLVVACPCALVISTPVTIVSALAGSARRGILIKGGLHLENAGRASVIAFDKTGTLTEGEPHVSGIAAMNGASIETILELAAAAESRSEHPYGRAVVRRAEQEGVTPVVASQSLALPGRGVEAIVSGQRVYVGNQRLFSELGVSEAMTSTVFTDAAASGQTIVFVGVVDKHAMLKVIGALALVDRVRSNAADALRALRSAGIRRMVMVTGDNEAVAMRVAAELGQSGVDEVHSGLLPEDKVALVQQLRQANARVLMVGDGVNDAPALAAADVGVAMGSAGTDVALETADIALMADDLTKLPEAVRFARKAERIIRANIAVSLLTKAAFLALAIAGLATLWMAVVADMGASLLVIANGLRALRVRDSSSAKVSRLTV